MSKRCATDSSVELFTAKYNVMGVKRKVSQNETLFLYISLTGATYQKSLFVDDQLLEIRLSV